MSTATPDTETFEILDPATGAAKAEVGAPHTDRLADQDAGLRPAAPAPATPPVVALVGDSRAGSLTGMLAATVAKRVGVELGLCSARTATDGENGSAAGIVDLGAIAMRRLAWGEGPPRDAVDRVLGAELLVVASTTHRGTYSGLLKLFLDALPDRALAGKLAVPVMSAVAPRHAMAPDVYLRPLLIELGASCPTPSLFALEARLANPSGICSSWIARARPTLLRR